MNDLVVINGVKGYMGKDGTAYLSLEDVARGLGFTTVATSGNEKGRATVPGLQSALMQNT